MPSEFSESMYLPPLICVMLCKTKRESITFVTYSISLSSLFNRQRQRLFNNPNPFSTIALALDKDLLMYQQNEYYWGMVWLTTLLRGNLHLLKVMVLHAFLQLFFWASKWLISLTFRNVLVRNILASCTLPVCCSNNLRNRTISKLLKWRSSKSGL